MTIDEIYNTINIETKLNNVNINESVNSIITSLRSDNAELVQSNNADEIINNILSFLDVDRSSLDKLTDSTIKQLKSNYNIINLDCNLLGEEVENIYRLLLKSIYYIQDGKDDKLNEQLLGIESYENIYEDFKKKRESNDDSYKTYTVDFLSDVDCRYYIKGGSNHFYLVCEILYDIINKYNEEKIVDEETKIIKKISSQKYELEGLEKYFAIALHRIYLDPDNKISKDFTNFIKKVLELFDKVGSVNFKTGNSFENDQNINKKVNSLKTQAYKENKNVVTDVDNSKLKKITEEVRKILKEEKIL